MRSRAGPGSLHVYRSILICRWLRVVGVSGVPAPPEVALSVTPVKAASAVHLAEALRAARRVSRTLTPGGWGAPSPCSAWSAQDVLNHVAATTSKFTWFAAGRTDSPRTPEGDLLGDDRLAALDLCIVASAEAWRDVDTSRFCRLPFGSFTAPEAAEINAFDVLVHTWDLAQVGGVDFAPAGRLSELAYRVALRLVTPEAVAAGHYAPPPFGRRHLPEPSWEDVLVITGRA